MRDAFVERGQEAEYLQKRGNAVFQTHTLDDGLELVKSESVDVILIDVSRSEEAALDACRRCRSLSKSPIIVLSCHWSLATKLKFFEAGIDDYVTKPLDPEEIEARIIAIIRRTSGKPAGLTSNGRLHVGEFDIDTAGRLAMRKNSVLKLTKLQFDFLRALASRPGEVVPYENLIKEVWGHDYVELDTVHVLVHHLRRRLGETNGSSAIRAIPGVGYRLWTDDVRMNGSAGNADHVKSSV